MNHKQRAPGVNHILMESCMRACIHKHTHHFGGIKYMHMHNKRHEGMRPYVLLGKCKHAHALNVCGNCCILALASLQLWAEATSARLHRFSHLRSSTAPFELSRVNRSRYRKRSDSRYILRFEHFLPTAPLLVGLSVVQKRMIKESDSN